MNQPPIEYVPFELLIGNRSDDGYPVTVIEAPAGEGESICTLRVDAELRDVLTALEAGNIDADFLTELGAFLFDELLRDEVATLYRTSLGMARQGNHGLRIRLRITPPELATLPWEYLFDRAENAFLATSPETALVRYVPVRLPVRPTAVELPLRILAVIASPQDAEPLDVAKEKSILREALGAWIEQGRVQLDVVERATIAAVTQAMRQHSPHVFHFVGHGVFESDTAYVLLEDEKGMALPVDDRTFREFFTGSQETRLAVLNACQTASVSTHQPLAGLAPHLLHRQLSAVVAMQYPIIDQSALIFTREFYRSLVSGAPIDAAVSEARKGIFLEMGAARSDWGTPVLFLRAKDGRLFAVAEEEHAPLEIPPPPHPTRPPEIIGFVGRDAELSYFAEKLENNNLAVIAGMAGVGKTALAATLIEWMVDDKEKVFWHSFHEGQGIDSVLWGLAGFLGWHGRTDLWRLLQSARLTGGQPPPPETLFDYVLQLVRGGNFILCFDDFHHVDDDPLLNQLVERLRSALTAGHLAIVVTSRRMPEFAQIVEFDALSGLISADVQRLLSGRGLHLSAEQVDALYTHTAGNAEFLILAIDALHQAKDPDLLIMRLAETDDIERYLLREVDETLSGQERSVLEAMAVLLGYTGTRHAIETVLNGGNVFRTLRRLVERHLLTVQSGDAGREYRLHDIVREFYYEMMSLRNRKTMHRRAGCYYEEVEPDLLRAGIHFERAGEVEHAAELATRDVWGIVNAGGARSLITLINNIPDSSLTPQTKIKLQLTRGHLYRFHGNAPFARTCYEDILSSNTEVNSNVESVAEAYLGMGESFELEDPTEALKWLSIGIKELSTAIMPESKARLYIASGTMYMHLGDYAEALSMLEMGVCLLPSTSSKLLATSYLNLDSVYFLLGDLSKAISYGSQALKIVDELNVWWPPMSRPQTGENKILL